MAEEEQSDQYTSFLGTGWSFPPKFIKTATSGSVVMTADEEDIQASLKILLGTTPGERFFVPKYGLDMHELLFVPISTTMTTLFKDRLKLTLLIYEPRIDLLSVDLDTSAQYEGKISVIIDYQIRGTNSRYNLVYPFYLTDGSEVRGTL